MALENVGDLQTELLVRNNRTTTDGFITDQILKDWTRQSHKWASSYKPWPFTEGRVSTTYTTGSGDGSDEFVFEGYKADSFRLLQIGGKRLRKLDFRNYQIFREETPDSTDRVFSDYGKIVFINPNADVSGTLTAWGQYQPEIDPTNLTAETVFTSYNAEINEALVEEMTSFLKRREHLPDEAELHAQRSRAILEEAWRRIQDEQYQYQTHETSGGMWKRMDVVEGGFRDDLFRRDQF